MRAFSFLTTDGFAVRVAVLSALCASVVRPTAAVAQWPGEVVATVLDAFTGDAVSGARVEVVGTALSALSNARGMVRLRGLQSGPSKLVFTALGYGRHVAITEVRDGRRTRLTVRLSPSPVALERLDVATESGAGFGTHTLTRSQVRSSAASTLGQLVATLPGLVLREDVSGGPQEISIRGSGPDAVLVLLDGAPVNDPVTGVADLSLISLSEVAEVRVLPGARSARFGPRALAGVVEVTTQRRGDAFRATTTTGSLGLLGGTLQTSRVGVARSDRLGLDLRHLGGDFSFALPDEVGGGESSRRNADLLDWTISGASERTLGSHRLNGRVQHRQTERGVPGKAFQQADSSRQRVVRTAVMLGWQQESEHASWTGMASGAWQSNRFQDPAPPLGLPFDDRTRLFHTAVRLDGTRTLGTGAGVTVGAGAALDHLRINASALQLAGDADRQTVVGGYVRTDLPLGERLRLSAVGRVDAGAGAGGVWSHTASGRYSWSSGSVALSHRSSYSPPTLGDQYFREGVGVRANPDLGPERVPSEVELTASLRAGGISAGGSAYAGDVRGMIVWLPDFRFVWSPQNTDVKRRGTDLWAEVSAGRTGISLRGSYSYARVTYDRPGSDAVQVVYRPRHTGRIDGAWEGTPWRIGVAADFIGTRYPVPSAINALAPFWSWSASLTRAWSTSAWNGEVSLDIDRLLNRRDTLIFGFPSPGRTLRVTARLAR